MMMKYLNKKDDHIWKVLLRDVLNKCGGCGDSGICMSLKKGGMSEFQTSVEATHLPESKDCEGTKGHLQFADVEGGVQSCEGFSV